MHICDDDLQIRLSSTSVGWWWPLVGGTIDRSGIPTGTDALTIPFVTLLHHLLPYCSICYPTTLFIALLHHFFAYCTICSLLHHFFSGNILKMMNEWKNTFCRIILYYSEGWFVGTTHTGGTYQFPPHRGEPRLDSVAPLLFVSKPRQ